MCRHPDPVADGTSDVNAKAPVNRMYGPQATQALYEGLLPHTQSQKTAK